MNLDELKQEWINDSNVDITKLGEESIKTIELHARYLSYLMDAKKILKSVEIKYHDLKRKKYLYYRGEMSRDDLEANGWKQYQGAKPLRSDLEDLLSTDSDLMMLDSKVTYYRIMVSSLEEIMKAISNRQWSIKAAIEWQKFIGGS